MSELQEDFEPEDMVSPSKPNVFSKTELRADHLPHRRPTSDGSSEIDIEKTQPEDFDMKQTNDEFDSTINSEISELTSEAFDTWMGVDSKWRRSPEGNYM